ncbi:hypothetical protein N9112_00235 [bacterium]|nr:hypothetical protein [bacterium]
MMYTDDRNLTDFYERWLGGAVEEVSSTMLIEMYGEEPEEVYSLPEGFEKAVEISELSVPGLAVGHVILGTWRGRRCIFEQNASPFLVYTGVL